MFCPSCGFKNADDANFCVNCGSPMNFNQQIFQQPATQPSSVRICESVEPLFRVKCEYCYCVFEYRPRDLGYRAWYPHGFVYCPQCRKPLRHRLENEVKTTNDNTVQQPIITQQSIVTPPSDDSNSNL